MTRRESPSRYLDGADLERPLFGSPGDRCDEGEGADRRAGQRFGVRPPGYEEAPARPTLGGVDTAGEAVPAAGARPGGRARCPTVAAREEDPVLRVRRR